jgi:hypothetical protein
MNGFMSMIENCSSRYATVIAVHPILKWRLLPHDFSIDGPELVHEKDSSVAIQRHIIEQNTRALIETMY